MRNAEHEKDPQFIAGNLCEENARLVQWIDSDVDRFAAVRQQAAEVRAQAHDLVDDATRQGGERQSREEALYLAKRRVHSQLDELPTEAPNWVYLAFGANPKLTGNGWGRQHHYREPDWEQWVESSEYWGQIKDEAKKLIAAASDQYTRREEARADAERAIQRMDGTVRCALDWSTTCFRDGETTPPPRRYPAKASTPPLAAFVLVALAGVDIAPTPIAGWIAFAFLLVVVVLSARRIVGDARRAASVATFAAGSSLASFTAAYLLVCIVYPDDVMRSGAPISSIAEAAFTSLTVGVTGGTIGTDLGGAARIVAFIQILVTVGAVASGIAWAWRRLVDRGDDQGTPTPRIEEGD
jgi:hypothetical protein